MPRSAAFSTHVSLHKTLIFSSQIQNKDINTRRRVEHVSALILATWAIWTADKI